MNSHTQTRLYCAALSLTAAALAFVPLARATFREPFVARNFAAAADHTAASQAAAEILRSGGSAADGAIAAALALGVVSPSASGLGGGGFATVCLPNGQCTFLDFRETAPSGLTIQQLRNPQAPATVSRIGGLAVGVPGEPKGLLELSQRFGRVPFGRTTVPAARLARQGFLVSSFLAQRLSDERVGILQDNLLSQTFIPGGQVVPVGARVRRPLLAGTIERFGREGERFVHGSFAQLTARAVQRLGGVLTEQDIRDYRVVERRALESLFQGYRIVTAPPPSGGGVLLLQALSLLESLPAAQRRPGSSAYLHALAESFRASFDDRARYITDPGPTIDSQMGNALLVASRLAERNGRFDPNRTQPVVVVQPPRGNGTTHICVMDRNGMAVALTTTINLGFGAQRTVPELDVLLNDEIDDFSLGTQGNNFGLANGVPNQMVPGRRPVSSMTPTIILRDGRPVGCVGGAGGPRIATATTQVLLNLLLHGMHAEAAVSAPRIHHQGIPAELLVEQEIAEDVRAGLRARGHTVTETPIPLATVQAIRVVERDGVRSYEAASDPRRGGLPAGE